MKPERLGKIADVIGGILTVPEAEAVYARGVSTDSRTIRPGEIFFAIRGARDGHDFVADAYQKGAIAAVVSRKVDVDIPQIIVNDTLSALGKLASAYREAIAPKVVAVTGSVGKTTTRRMIAAVLREKFSVHSARRNFNNLIGLPLTLLDMPEDTRVAVVELGINQFGEMEKLARIAKPDVAVITHIAPVHTEGLGDLDSIADEKLKVVDFLPPDGVVVLNADSPHLRERAQKINRRVVTYAVNSPADFVATDVQFENGRPSFRIDGLRVRLNLLGLPAVYSALAAFAVGTELGIPPKICAEALESVFPAPHRMELINLGGVKVLDDSYNSSPGALTESLNTMELIDSGRKVVVLGDMLELGDFAERYHREAGREIARRNIDVALLFGELMGYAAEELSSANFGGKFLHTTDFDEGARFLRENIVPGDLVLVKGSHGLEMIKFVEMMKKWLSGEK
ncbi:UDP-N-acetylmuramoyl-tripeptide--D-alanyl-D-alanine ligase [bacterium]|nr:UDP-N-acetylmuramoyl-tripeptide--D-alanyl-D-alanine ligase [bacterium]